MKRLLACLAFTSVAFCPLFAAEADSTAICQRWQFGLREGYVFPSNDIVKGFNSFDAHVRSAFAADAQWMFSFAPSSRNGRYYPHAYQGVGLGWTAFSSSRITGNPINLYVMQGSRIASFGSRLSLDYEWNFGISFPWKKRTSDDAFDYTTLNGLGSHCNAYINLGFKLNYAATSNLTLFAGVDVSHFSNGNTNYPNPGINMLWGRLGATWIPGAQPKLRRADWSDWRPHMSLDVTAYGAWRKHTFNSTYYIDIPDEYHVVPGHFAVAGLNINPLWRFNPMLAAGLSADFQYDEGANLSPYYVEGSWVDDPKFYRPPFSHSIMAGLSARVELKMPIFTINVGLGHSLYAPGGDAMRGWYQMFTLKTFVAKGFYLSTGYRLVRFSTPGNLMLGCGYSFEL